MLLDFLKSRGDHVRLLLRPPFGRFRELTERPGKQPARHHRDPRVMRDTMQDMRMPPYMRDSDENPLSLTWRQYHLLLDLVTYLEEAATQGPVYGPRVRAVRRHLETLKATAMRRPGETS
jgi:hypothetical protein